MNIALKLDFINSIMESLGYEATQCTQLQGMKDYRYFVIGLGGWQKGREFISFEKGQRIARSFLFKLKSHKPGDTKFNFWQHDIVISLDDMARITFEALNSSKEGYKLLMGDYRAINYNNRKRIVVDQSTGEVLTVKGITR